MKYRGFVILKKYSFDCRPPRANEGIVWVEKRGDFEGYAIYDPVEENRLWDIYPAIEDCKKEVDRVCDEVLHMKDNSPVAWAKLK